MTSEELIDLLWGLLGTPGVDILRTEYPEAYARCQENHERLWHGWPGIVVGTEPDPLIVERFGLSEEGS